MQEKIDHKGKNDEKRPGGPEVSLVASLEKNSKWWVNNYCWAIDRTSNTYDDIQAMIIIKA